MTRLFGILLFISQAFIFQSCSEDEGDENKPAVDNGTFQAAVTGNLSKEIEGNASFSHAIIETQAAEGSRLNILLFNEENQDEYITITIMVRDDMDGVDPGTYTVNHSSSEAPFVTIYFNSEQDREYMATNTGTIQLAERTDARTWGSFSAKLIEIQSRTVEISGDFNAESN